MSEKLETIALLSREYGSDSMYVFLGGGNTSVKADGFLYIKPSGTALATIQADQFLKIDREALDKVFEVPLDGDVKTREALSAAALAAAVRPVGAGRPSVEAPVHNVVEWTYIVHLHPALVNGLTCSNEGEAACKRMFPDALWVDYCDPGYTLSCVVKKALDAWKAEKGSQPHVMFLQNHGVFVGADTPEEVRGFYKDITEKLTAVYQKAGIEMEEKALPEMPAETAETWAPRLRTLLAPDATCRSVVIPCGLGKPFAGPLTPDHVVYARGYAYTGDGTAESLDAFAKKTGYRPKLVCVEGQGVFAVGDTRKDAKAVSTALKNSLLVERLTNAFGGPHYLSERQYQFIQNWEVESYRRKVSVSAAGGRLGNRVCVVTGGAQGFGLGIAKELAANGGILVLADMNLEGAKKAADAINAEFGADRAMAVGVNVSDEDSVKQMMTDVVRLCGGVDVFVACAGVVRAGSVMTMEKKAFDFVTSINYTGYFLCTKYASKIMAAQIVDGKGLWSDIVEINSKSGLAGSNKNGAYAGSKFGGVGLTQSFALELVTSCIKVNCVCPGNYYDGPLWSDPERGLFVEYLKAGKVPGAKTVEDVKEFYLSKSPIHRGCLPVDVARAIMYCVEQQYETGQAIPVTGGQVMLH